MNRTINNPASHTQDMTATIRQAIADCSVTGGEVLFKSTGPIDFYKTTSDLIVPPNVSIRGEPGTRIKSFHSGNLFKLLQSDRSCSRISDLHLIGSGLNPETMLATKKTELDFTDVGISIVFAHRAQIERVSTEFFGRAGIYIEDSFYCSLRDVESRYCGVGIGNWSGNGHNNNLRTSNIHLQYNLNGADNLDGDIDAEGNYYYGLRLGMPGLSVSRPAMPGVIYHLDNFYAEGNGLAQYQLGPQSVPLGDIYVNDTGICSIDFNSGHWASDYAPYNGRNFPTYHIVSRKMGTLWFRGSHRRYLGAYPIIYCENQFDMYDTDGAFSDIGYNKLVAGGAFIQYYSRGGMQYRTPATG